MMNAFIYLRVSTDDKGQDAGLQLADCQRLAQDKHLTVTEVFKEEASAWKKIERPIFTNMTQRAIKEGIEYIIVWDMDRLYRQRVEMVSFVKEMSRGGIKVISTRQKWLEDLAKIPRPWDEIVYDLVMNILGWIAEEESNKKSERVKLAVKKTTKGTFSRSGKKWGRKGLPKQTIDRVLELHRLFPKMGVRKIAEQAYQYDKSGNKRSLSRETVRMILTRKGGGEK